MYSHLHQPVVTSLKIVLLQADSHGKHLTAWNLRLLRPLLTPLRQMALMQAVRCRDLSLCSDGVGDGTCQRLEDEATSQNSNKRAHQHGSEDEKRGFGKTRVEESSAGSFMSFMFSIPFLITSSKWQIGSGTLHDD